MKKWILILVMGLLLIGVNLFAADGDLIVNGNVGIGTTSPGYKLEVAGVAKFSGNAPTDIAIGDSSSYDWQYHNIFSDGNGHLNIQPQWNSGTHNLLLAPSGGNVGIGTASPWQKLHVSGTGSTWILVNDTGQTSNAFFGIEAGVAKVMSQGNGIALRTDGGNGWSDKLSVTNAGNVGIGTWNPSYQLQLSTDSAAKPSTSTWRIVSDARLKTNIQPYAKGLKEILQINPVTFEYNGKGGIGHNKVKVINPVTGKDTEIEIVDTELLSKTNIGVLAQDIQSVVPESVTSHKGKINDDDADETDLLDFNSHSLTFILINAVKELKAQIDSLEEQIADLKAKVK